MSADNPEWDRDVEVNGEVYHVHFDQTQDMVRGIECPHHPGHIANMVDVITIHEVNDENDLPLPAGTDVEALKAKILTAMGHMVEQCHQCHVEDEASLV